MRAILIKGARLIDPSQGLDREGDLFLQDGKIQPTPKQVPQDCQVMEARGLVACPGFIDLHCHLREPGFEEKETIATGTQAAARGGFTTVCCMPNTEPPIDTAATVEFVLRRAKETGAVRVYPIGCVSKGRQGKELAEMAELAQAGVVGFSDDGSPVYDTALMRLALSYSRSLGLPIMDHCEEPSLSKGGAMHEGWVSHRLGLKGIPAAAEEAMVARNIVLAELTGGHVHICHASTAGTVELVRRAKEKGLPVTAEVCPHHLTLTDEWVAGYRGDGKGAGPLGTLAYDTRAKVNPPLRSRLDVEAVVQGLREGVLDCVATDHAPHDVVSKEVTFLEAANGISVLETALGSLMGLVHGGKISLPVLIERLTLGPARVLGERFLEYATLKPGTPADVVLLDPHREWVVDARRFASKGRNTPLDGMTLKGKVMATIVEGRVVYQEESLTESTQRG